MALRKGTRARSAGGVGHVVAAGTVGVAKKRRVKHGSLSANTDWKVPSAEAVEKLGEVLDVLSKTPQGQGAPLIPCVRAAAANELVKHPDCDVRLWAAKCLAEGLRIFAPKPPLEAHQLRATLELFIEQLAKLAEPNNAALEHAVGLLERLTEVCAFVLIFDCENPDALLLSVVKVCLSAAHSSEGARLESLLTRVLIGVLGEADSIPKPVLAELIQELTPRRECRSAAVLVRQVLADLANHSAVLTINEFLKAALFEQSHRDDGFEELESAREKDARAALLYVVFELFTINEALVARVLPNLLAELQCEAVGWRRAVTILVGRMLSHRGAASPFATTRPPLVTTHPLLLERYLERLADTQEAVRLVVLEGLSALLAATAADSGGGEGGDRLTAAAGVTGRIGLKLLERCLDPSDAMRLRVVEVVSQVAGSAVGLRALAPVLPEVFRRILDRRPHVREAAATALAQLYAQHALPAWTAGCGEAAGALAWAPQLLCEAHAVFASGGMGHTVLLEELIEQHALGSGARLEPPKRALALLGFCVSATHQGGAVQALDFLLRRKRDANSALRRYLQLRLEKAAPTLGFKTASGVLPSLRQHDADNADADSAATVLEDFGRLSPTMEDCNVHLESLVVPLRALDAVRDQTFWNQLECLSHPVLADGTAHLESLLVEFDRLLRVHRLADLAPLFRRAFSSTWLLPDQVPSLLDAWANAGQPTATTLSAGPVRRALVDLTRFFPDAFMPHVQSIVLRLSSVNTDDVHVALRMLGALGKSANNMAGQAPHTTAEVCRCPVSERGAFVEVLLKACARLCQDQDSMHCGSVCRKAVRAFALLPGAELVAAVGQALQWAEEKGIACATGLHLAAACLAWLTERQDGPHRALLRMASGRWLALVKQIMDSSSSEPSKAVCAVMEVCAAIDAEKDILMMGKAKIWGIKAALHLVVCSGRALRHGAMALTTTCLSHLASQLRTLLTEIQAAPEMDVLLGALQMFQKPSNARLRMVDRLRLCTTLPAMFAFAPAKQHRDVMHRSLQTSFLKAIQHSALRQEPLLDFAVACFLHFLSRLDLFRAEAAAAVSAFPQSTKVAAFFCDALLRSDTSRSTQLAGIILRVCDRVRFFVDREDPGSDAVHRAAHALRYVVERYPSYGRHGGALLPWAARGRLPARGERFYGHHWRSITARAGGQF